MNSDEAKSRHFLRSLRMREVMLMREEVKTDRILDLEDRLRELTDEMQCMSQRLADFASNRRQVIERHLASGLNHPRESGSKNPSR